MPLPTRARALLAVPTLTLLLGGLLGACGSDDEPKDDATSPAESTSAETSETSEPTETTEPTEAAATIDPDTVERLAQEVFEPVKECPDGEFQETDSLLTTLDEKYAAQATTLLSYACGGRIDQVVYADFADPAIAAEALPADTDAAFNAATWVDGTVVVAMNFGVEDDKVDIVAFFEQLTAECGCGETEYQG